MDHASRAQSTLFRRREKYGMFALAAAGVVFGVAVSCFAQTRYPELSKALATGAVTLFFGALLGGVVTQLIADFDRGRVKRAAQLDFISNVLTDLKTVYDRVDRGRTLIRSHQSAKTYGEQMRSFIEARVKLLNVARALTFDERGMSISTIRENVTSMEQYLKTLINEFEANYKEISRSQSVYEARMNQALQTLPSDPDAPLTLPQNRPWETIKTLRAVEDFMAPLNRDPNDLSPKNQYSSLFLQPLDRASLQLRKALINELS